ncbi:hypothetical protein EZS27_021785 [termite gut metagenome]|uniref:Mobilization protein n=1 Tax=termite gut metagenome TaxID=433724 RepID=A0A5J4R6R6_9ZZZZ
MELTKKYGLYIASGKENVKRERLREPDKTKYEIYDTIKAIIPGCKNWRELTAELKKQGITTEFRYNGDTNKIQGVRFGKNDYTFNGSKIDRTCSYSKIEFQLQQNSREQEVSIRQSIQSHTPEHSIIETASSVLGSLFDIQPESSDYDADQAEYLRQQSLKKKKKRKGFRI